ncbi:MAG: VOC family protein [Sulfitobacter sp.]|nr:VOC family protein [Sulfitobacter sp.]
MNWKPEDYPSVSPYLLVREAEVTLAFVEQVFGAERLRLHMRKEGQGVMHAEARIDDSVIMMGEVAQSQEAHVHIYVPDAEAAFARALAAGGQVIQPLLRQADGDYRGGVAEGNGVIWWIAQEGG